MNVPDYVSKDEVKRVCTELKLRDWSGISEPVVTREEQDIPQELTAEIQQVF